MLHAEADDAGVTREAAGQQPRLEAVPMEIQEITGCSWCTSRLIKARQRPLVWPDLLGLPHYMHMQPVPALAEQLFEGACLH